MTFHGAGGRVLAALAMTAAALVSAAGCAAGPDPVDTTPGGQGPPLAGTEWQLTSYRAPGGGPVAVEPGTDATLQFDGEGQFSAHICNYIDGRAAIGSGVVTLRGGATTAMACTGALGTLEDQFLATARGDVDWAIADRTLTLTGRDGHELTYGVGP